MTNIDKNGTLSFIASSQPSHGKLLGLSIVDGNSAKITYIPNKNYEGPDAFEYKAMNKSGQISSPANVDLTIIEHPNSVPIAKPLNIETSTDRGGQDRSCR